MASFIAAGLMVVVVFAIVAATWISSRRYSARIDAALAQVRPWTDAHGYELSPPSWAARLGIGWDGFAVHGRVREVTFELLFNCSSHGGQPYTQISAVPSWLPKGGFHISKDRAAPEAWEESGLWVVASPAEVAVAVRARRVAVVTVAGLPTLRSVNAMNIEVPGAKRKECVVVCEGWMTDQSQLNRLVDALATWCTPL